MGLDYWDEWSALGQIDSVEDEIVEEVMENEHAIQPIINTPINAPIKLSDFADTQFNIRSYPKIFQVGHRGIAELFMGDVLIEEKVDGSQFSFMVDDKGILHMRSKGAEVYAGEKSMFSLAIKAADLILPLLRPSVIYRCEFLMKPKHNTLVYDRVPKENLILFDVEIGNGEFLNYADKLAEGERIGLEVVPKLYEGEIIHKSQLQDLLGRVSILGGQQIEGMVVKNYAQFGADKKVQMGKFVREDFTELNQKAWRSDPDKTTQDVIQQLGDMFNTPARWEKAIQHLRDEGKLLNAPQDIGNLMVEIHRDITEEEKELIQHTLYRWGIKRILRIATSGFPIWYKARLLDQSFEEKEKV